MRSSKHESVYVRHVAVSHFTVNNPWFRQAHLITCCQIRWCWSERAQEVLTFISTWELGVEHAEAVWLQETDSCEKGEQSLISKGGFFLNVLQVYPDVWVSWFSTVRLPTGLLSAFKNRLIKDTNLSWLSSVSPQVWSCDLTSCCPPNISAALWDWVFAFCKFPGAVISCCERQHANVYLDWNHPHDKGLNSCATSFRISSSKKWM